MSVAEYVDAQRRAETLIKALAAAQEAVELRREACAEAVKLSPEYRNETRIAEEATARAEAMLAAARDAHPPYVESAQDELERVDAIKTFDEIGAQLKVGWTGDVRVGDVTVRLDVRTRVVWSQATLEKALSPEEYGRARVACTRETDNGLVIVPDKKARTE